MPTAKKQRRSVRLKKKSPRRGKRQLRSRGVVRAQSVRDRVLNRAVAAMLKGLRKRHGLTQRQFAKAIGWQRSKVAQAELAKRMLKVPELIVIAQLLEEDPIAAFREVLQYEQDASRVNV